MFTKLLTAAVTLPALPKVGMATAAPAASVPSQARYWAVYMDSLHGKCTPKALQTMLNIPAAQAEGYLQQLVLDGTIRPNHLLNALRKPTKVGKPDLWDRLKARFEEKSEVLIEDKDPEPAVEEDATPVPEAELAAEQENSA